MSEFCSNREANRLFCAWRQTREIRRIGCRTRALRFASSAQAPRHAGALLWAEFGPSLAHDSARKKASVLERICSPGIRLCFGSLRFALFSGLTPGIWQRRTSDEGLEFRSPPPGRAVSNHSFSSESHQRSSRRRRRGRGVRCGLECVSQMKLRSRVVRRTMARSIAIVARLHR